MVCSVHAHPHDLRSAPVLESCITCLKFPTTLLPSSSRLRPVLVLRARIVAQLTSGEAAFVGVAEPMCAVPVLNACFLAGRIERMVIFSADGNLAIHDVGAGELLHAREARLGVGLVAKPWSAPSSTVAQVIAFSSSFVPQVTDGGLVEVPSICVKLADPKFTIVMADAFLATLVIEHFLGISCDGCLHDVCTSHELESCEASTIARLGCGRRVWDWRWRRANVVDVDNLCTSTSTTSNNGGCRSHNSLAWRGWPRRFGFVSPIRSCSSVLARLADTAAMLPFILESTVDRLIPTLP
mmetsp:Transcript_153220/g.267091  ORF Transcript_153220/g.267091 Transcript_153220/m.267091 type:complete len:297 (+) Transcript_153220:591-1481(+)